MRYLFTFVCLLIGASSSRCAPATPAPASEVVIVSRWLRALQFTGSQNPSFGALKIHHTPSAMGADGTPYFRVSPYNSNLGVLGFLTTRSPDARQTAERWVTWYFTHLNTKSAPDGVPLEHFYRADGSGETTCVKPGDPALCDYNDATDSAAATFFSVLWATHKAGGKALIFERTGRREQIEKLAVTLLSLQQADGLFWAKKDYRAKYLEDNSEVYAGLRDLANLHREVYKDRARARFYAQAAARVRKAILDELYDPKTQLYKIAKFEDGKYHAANLDVWYPDMQAQMWPHLWGVTTATDARTQAVVAALDKHWNNGSKRDWAKFPGAASNGWIEAGVAHAVLLAGADKRVQTYLEAVKRLKFPQTSSATGFDWPFSIADAGWLLASLSHIQSTSKSGKHR